MDSPVFNLQDCRVAYGDTAVLHGISLRVDAGEKVAVIGPSGAGKTTLLRHLYGLQTRRSAFVHQDYALVPQLSVFHNVYSGRLDLNGAFYNLRNLLRPARAEVQKVGAVLEGLGLGDQLLTPVHRLSGGQQQRVAVGRALYRGGDILLGDEPVAAVDPHRARTVLQALRGGAATVVLSLHDVELALEFFGRVVGLRGGRVAFDLPAGRVDRARLDDLYRPC